MKGVEIEFVTVNDLDASEPAFSQFASVFAHFQFPEAGQVCSFHFFFS